jgi:E1 N-terminal domain/ThiF family
MNEFAQRENVRTLAAIVGIGEQQAAELLDVSALVTHTAEDLVAAECAKHVLALLGRTLRNVQSSGDTSNRLVAVEVVIGAAQPRSNGPHVFLHAMEEEFFVSSSPVGKSCGRIHRIGILLAACYAAAAALKMALGDVLPFHVPATIHVRLSDVLGADLPLIYKPLFIEDTYLAGAGAVGNGFVYALGQFDAGGKLNVVDDDSVGDGNLHRCLLFREEHLNQPKAEVLSEAASRLLPKLSAIPRNARIQDLPERKAGPWIKRLVVGVDSPRARRSLQSEFPGEVFDASTTGISEVVLHFHKQPTTGACLGCVYPHTAQEDAHESHVAEALGVTLSDVREARISPSAAAKICLRFPHLNTSKVVGAAYDTLFKALCSTQSLKKSEDRQVLAPFAFVSVLAGTFLAIEFVRRTHRGHDALFNEWRVSPWSNLVLRRRRILAKNANCDFCNDPVLADVIRQMWSQPN